MAKKVGNSKLFRFADLANYRNVFQKNPEKKGKWTAEVFKNSNPITIELACGKAEYARGLAKLFPERNFVGMDIKGNRLWSANRLARIDELENIAFIRDRIENLDLYFDLDELNEIWITFPDPFRKDGDAKKRLTSSRFLSLYKKIVSAGTLFHLKTDNTQLFDFSVLSLKDNGWKILELSYDIYKEGKTDMTYNIQTHYEKLNMAKGETIKYLRFTF